MAAQGQSMEALAPLLIKTGLLVYFIGATIAQCVQLVGHNRHGNWSISAGVLIVYTPHGVPAERLPV